MRRINQRRTKNVVTTIPYVCFLVKQECSSQVVRLCRKGSFLWNSVQDNEVVYSKETEWDVTNADPQYHYDAILAALKLAKDTLPKVEKLDQLDPTPQIHPNPSIQTGHNFCSNFNLKVIPFFKISKQRRSVDVEVDAIGGSATGTVSALNEATWCDISPTCLLMSTRRRWWTSSFAWERTVDHHLFQIKMYDYGRLALSWLPNVGKIAPNCDSKWFGYLCDDIWCCTWYILQNVRRSSCTCVSPAEGWDLLLVRWSCQPCCMLHGLHVK